MPDEEYLTIAEAAARLGLHRVSISRKIAAGELPAYVGANRRKKLLKRRDVERLAAPQPVASTAGKEGAA